MSYTPQIYHPTEDDESETNSDIYSTASFEPFAPSMTESSQTSFEISAGRSASPVPSVQSMSSSMRDQALREEYGRLFNSHSDVYALPADEEELNRLSA